MEYYYYIIVIILFRLLFLLLLLVILLLFGDIMFVLDRDPGKHGFANRIDGDSKYKIIIIEYYYGIVECLLLLTEIRGNTAYLI